jgi:hypothetical protein
LEVPIIEIIGLPKTNRPTISFSVQAMQFCTITVRPLESARESLPSHDGHIIGFDKVLFLRDIDSKNATV